MPKTIVIQGEQFEVSTPFEAGHPLTELEANVLNQVRCENIRNNLAKRIKSAKEANEFDHAAMTKEVAEYDKSYEFAAPGAGGGSRTLDPVEREARRMARNIIKDHLAAKGAKISDIEKEVLDAKIAEVVADEKVLKAAQKAVADQNKLKEGVLAGL